MIIVTYDHEIEFKIINEIKKLFCNKIIKPKYTHTLYRPNFWMYIFFISFGKPEFKKNLFLKISKKKKKKKKDLKNKKMC